MKYLAVLLVLALGACGTSPEHRVNLKIRNKTSKTMKLRASTGMFAQAIVLQPGQEWHGWWDRRFLGKEAAFDIYERAEPAPEEQPQEVEKEEAAGLIRRP